MKQYRLISVLLLLILIVPLWAEESIVLGEEDQWQGIYLHNLRTVEGREGYLDLQVAHDQRVISEETDFLLDFNGPGGARSQGPYQVIRSPEIQLDFARLGEGTAYFNEGSSLVLQPQPGALFYPHGDWQDFSLSFWLYPAVLEEGEILLQWKGFLQTGERILSQELVCRISDRSLRWDFQNFFLSTEKEDNLLQLQGDRLIPRKWSHHLIRYRYDIGQLEYLIDGKPAAVIYTTESKREEAKVLHPRIEQTRATPINIGTRFSGFMDELSLTRQWEEVPRLLDYESPGYFLTPILDFQYQDSRIMNLDLLDRSSGTSRILYYYRLFNRWEDAQAARMDMMDRENPESGLSLWKSFKEGEEINERGRYLVVAGILYPDIGAELSPALSRIRVDYEEHLPPVPPLNLRAVSVKEGIQVRWDYSENSGIDGFLIYFGDRPGQYFGPGSPIRVSAPAKSYTIEGLENYKTWYISMVAYNSSEPPQYSDFSREVPIRP